MSTPRHTTRLRTIAALSLVPFALLGCSNQTAEKPAPAASAQGCITNFDEATDYFTTKVEPTLASNFSVDYRKSFAVLTVNKPNPTDKTEKYVLVRCGAPKPKLDGDLATAQQVTIPLQKVGTVSATQIASFELLDALDQLAGVGDAKAVISEKTNALIKQGKVAELGSAGSEIDVEKVVAAKPDALLQAGMASPAYPKLRELGTPTIADGAWLEKTPLGRAEWVKFYGLLLGRENGANKRFEQIKSDYEATKQKVAAITDRPKVLVGTQFKGDWTVPLADSYVATYVKDAGGDYVFADRPGSGTTKLDSETVYSTGQQAKVWLNGNWMSKNRWKKRSDALALDPRFAELPAFKALEVYNPTKRLGAGGGNDYWESGIMRPDLVLADIAQVLHPDQFEGRELYYYTQLAEG